MGLVLKSHFDKKKEMTQTGHLLVVDTSLKYDLCHDFMNPVARIWFGCVRIL